MGGVGRVLEFVETVLRGIFSSETVDRSEGEIGIGRFVLSVGVRGSCLLLSSGRFPSAIGLDGFAAVGFGS